MKLFFTARRCSRSGLSSVCKYVREVCSLQEKIDVRNEECHVSQTGGNIYEETIPNVPE